MTNFRSRLAAMALLPLLVLPVLGIASGTEKPRTADPAFPLKVSRDGRHLVDRAGNPFLVVGDSPWSLIVGNNGSDTNDWVLILDAR